MDEQKQEFSTENPTEGNSAPLPPQPDNQEKSFGPLIGIIIIIVLLVIGGLYYWFNLDIGTERDEMTAEEILAEKDLKLEALEQQGTSDEVAAIEEDLAATDLEGLDAELEQIDQELGL